MNNAMIREHDRVVLTAPIAELGLEPGDIGAVVTVAAGQGRAVTKTEIPHARELALR